jgi:5-oxoprolinase (ATP-hydrolysing)
MFCDGQWRDALLARRGELAGGHVMAGPGIIVDESATTVIDPGWAAMVGPGGELTLERRAARAEQVHEDAQANEEGAPDPVRLEIFNSLFMSIAEQMGLQLQNSAHSVNIKERLDFSCAVFDGTGKLIANAPHIPVHLGSMGESVRTVIRANAGHIRPGNAYMLNAPFAGGTHLPDITVVTPVFPPGDDDDAAEPWFYVASRGHHADVGGITPGSVPPFSRSLDEEGTLVDNFLLVEGGRLREAETAALFGSGPYPARNIAQNLADLAAQVAANATGARELHRMVEQFGLPQVRAYMGHVQCNAEQAVRRALDKLDGGASLLELDDGARICVRVAKAENGDAVIDFSGTSPQLPSNFNAPAAVTMAAVLYVFRTLVRDDIPLNEGCLRPLSVVLPEGSMLNPRFPAAVVAGNVETSQCVTDALYGAIGALAGSQGTMNNFTFGNARYQYYETIAGGSGAGPGFPGTDAVQTHMTNSRMTDPEVIEWRFPVRLEKFAIRRGSGGAGRWRGGDGVVRQVRFLEPMTAAILSGHRRVSPQGLDGGGPGRTGRNAVLRAATGTAEARWEELPACAETEMQPGDVFVIETPGGGGCGVPGAG